MPWWQLEPRGPPRSMLMQYVYGGPAKGWLWQGETPWSPRDGWLDFLHEDRWALFARSQLHLPAPPAPSPCRWALHDDCVVGGRPKFHAFSSEAFTGHHTVTSVGPRGRHGNRGRHERGPQPPRLAGVPERGACSAPGRRPPSMSPSGASASAPGSGLRRGAGPRQAAGRGCLGRDDGSLKRCCPDHSVHQD